MERAQTGAARVSPEMAAALDTGALVLTSSARLARSLRRHYSLSKKQSGATRWPSPHILSWNGWLSDLWKQCLFQGLPGVPLLMNSFQERMLWDSAIRQSPEAAHLLQLDSTAAAAQQAWNLLHRHRIPMKRAAFQVSEDTAAFFDWSRAYQTRAKRLDVLDAARLSDWIRDRFAEGAIPPPSQIWLAGFEDAAPQQEDLLKAIENAGCAIVESQFLDLPSEDAELQPYPDAASEMYAAANWAREKLQRDLGCSVGIVTPNLGEARGFATRVFREMLKDAFLAPSGRSLATLPVVHSALLALETFRPRLAQEAVTGILLSPYLDASAREGGARARLDARLRSWGGVHWSLPVLADASARHDCPALARAIQHCETVSATLAPSAWARLFAQRLQDFGWLGGVELDNTEAQAVEDWRAALNQLSSLDVVASELAVSEALALLRRLVRETSFTEDDAGQPVALLSIAEAAGSDFDYLWIIGVHEDAWPAAPSPTPFLPVALQAAHKVPGCTPRTQLDLALRLTRRLLASAGQVVVSYPMMVGERPLGPSPLVSHLRTGLNGGRHAHWYLRPAALESFLDDAAPPVPDGSITTGGARSLELQAACPFRAFAEMRLGARTLESPDLGLDPRQRGQLVHKAMELLWARLGSQETLLGLTGAQLDSVVEASVAEAVRLKKLPGGRFHEKLKEMEVARISAMIHDWLTLERDRAPFTVIASEQERAITVAGLHFSTRVDRVDQLPDGSHVLIDYKTNAPAPDAWDGSRPDQPQLPLYTLSFDAPLAGVAFAQMRTGDFKFRGHASRQGLLPGVDVVDSLPQQVRLWRQVVEDLAANYRDGHAEVDPKFESTCDYCRLHSLCRIHD